MSYTCTDFTDSILDALDIELDDDELDSPSDQADKALVEIDRLQKAEKALRELVATCEGHPAFTNPDNTITMRRMANARAALAKAEGTS